LQEKIDKISMNFNIVSVRRGSAAEFAAYSGFMQEYTG
jgi:hypothetical protein